jgi:dTDP-4-amino-4,6-dideoxygalactose transaminase
MLVTDNPEYARLARQLRAHGIERDPSKFIGFGSKDPAFTEQGPWVYEMQELGYNHRITDIQCALGRSQLRKLNQFIERRQEIVALYNTAFADINCFTTPKLASWLSSNSKPVPAEVVSVETQFSSVPPISWHLYTIQIDFLAIGLTRTEVMHRLKEKGVGTQVLYIPVHLQPWYRKTFGYLPGKCPVAEAYYTRALSLPLYPAMTNEDVERVIFVVRELTTL